MDIEAINARDKEGHRALWYAIMGKDYLKTSGMDEEDGDSQSQAEEEHKNGEDEDNNNGADERDQVVHEEEHDEEVDDEEEKDDEEEDDEDDSGEEEKEIFLPLHRLAMIKLLLEKGADINLCYDQVHSTTWVDQNIAQQRLRHLVESGKLGKAIQKHLDVRSVGKWQPKGGMIINGIHFLPQYQEAANVHDLRFIAGQLIEDTYISVDEDWLDEYLAEPNQKSEDYIRAHCDE